MAQRAAPVRTSSAPSAPVVAPGSRTRSTTARTPEHPTPSRASRAGPQLHRVLDAQCGESQPEIERHVREVPRIQPAAIRMTADVAVRRRRRPVEVGPPHPAHQNDARQCSAGGGHRPRRLGLDASHDRDQRLAQPDQREEADALGQVRGMRGERTACRATTSDVPTSRASANAHQPYRAMNITATICSIAAS